MWSVLCLVGLLLSCSSAWAAMYKCLDDHGSTVYASDLCMAGEMLSSAPPPTLPSTYPFSLQLFELIGTVVNEASGILQLTEREPLPIAIAEIVPVFGDISDSILLQGAGRQFSPAAPTSVFVSSMLAQATASHPREQALTVAEVLRSGPLRIDNKRGRVTTISHGTNTASTRYPHVN